MKRLLLTGALMGALTIPSYAGYTDTDGLSTYTASFESVTYHCNILDEDAKTIGISAADGNLTASDGEFRIPSTLTLDYSVYDEENNEWVNYSNDFTVEQINTYAFQGNKGFADAITTLSIPSTVKAIGYRTFTEFRNLQSVIFEESDEPIEVLGAFYNNLYSTNPYVNLSHINIGRNIIFTDKNSDEQTFAIPGSDNEVEITVGSKVTELAADFFHSLPNISRVNIADWGKWYNDVKLGNVNANPYANGKAAVYVAGMKLTTIEIPSDATEIPDYKLAGMSYQGELTLPETLKRIGAYSFAGNSDLFYVNIPEGLEEIGDNAFADCISLRFEELPSSLKSIGAYAFSGCNLISSITLPESVVTLGEGAFYKMESLNKAVLFSGVTELPAYCFAECPALANVYLPKRLRSIGTGAFMYCGSLEEITLPEILEEIGDGAFANVLIETAQETTSMIHSYINDRLKDILYYTYGWQRSATSLTAINFPASLKKIGKFAFYGNKFITLEFNEGLTEIDDLAFIECAALRDVKFSSTIERIGAGAFESHQQEGIGIPGMLNSVAIPDNLKEIGMYAFLRPIGEISTGNGITKLTEGCLGYPSIINLGENVKSLDAGALDTDNSIMDYTSQLDKLRLIRVKSKTAPGVANRFTFADTDYDRINLVVNDGKADTFKRNPYWEKFNITEEAKSEITVYVSGEYPISEEIRTQAGAMPSTVSKMIVTGKLADSDYRLIRENMLSLYSLDLSAISNTEIPDDAFTGMPQLTEIKLPANTTKIGARAFENNVLMDTPALPETITEIGEAAFAGCARLSITKLPDALTGLTAPNVFYGCKSLRTLTFGENFKAPVQDTRFINGMLFQGESHNIFADCTLLEFVDMGQTQMESIYDNFFDGCSNLRNVILPSTLRQIRLGAFSNTSLESIDLPESVTEVSAGAFQGTRLRTLTIPENVTSILGSTFSNNPRLVSINLPSTLKSIGAGIFENSLKLSAISCSAIDAPDAATGAFDGIRASRCSLTVPQQSFRSYLNAPQWGMFSELYNRLVVEIPESVEVTAVDEHEYQEILEEERLQAAVDAPIEEEEVEENEGEDEEETPELRRRAVRRAASNSIADGSSFARLFDGAMLGTSSSSKGTRIFVNLKDGATLKSIIYNGVDITSSLEGNSILLEGAGNGTLQINAIGGTTAVDEIDTPETTADEICDIYDMNGVLLYSGVRKAATLAPGIYIVRTANGTPEKVVIR